MMTSSSKENKKIKKPLKIILVLFFWLAVWEAASLLVSDELKIFLPSPFRVIEKWVATGFTYEYIKAALATLLRIFVGFAAGIFTGFILGILTSAFSVINLLLSPVLKCVRAVPVVSFIILAFLFLKVDYLPIFISFLMVVPLIWQTVHDSAANPDRKLKEMCAVYGIKKTKAIFRVYLPQALPQIITACVNALGFAWKSGVAAEVICTPDVSLGHKIYSAKSELNFDEVYAVTLTVILLSLFIEFLLKFLFRKRTTND
ncbi:MAG: ABC transporter permease subunit [Ruminococcus sp.]|nr:ABC transporter permease subunit [Candidatus Copronaster equi]